MKIFLIVILLTIFACAKVTVKNKAVEAIPVWFDVPSRFSPPANFGDAFSKIPIHSFFDLVPFAKVNDKEINFVPTTYENSVYRYDIDLVSGRLYLKTPYCSQKDVWQHYKGDLKLPNFTEGFVPRLFDQLGMPQKIIVFGKRRYFEAFDIEGKISQRVRVIGGTVLQYCNNYPCRTNSEWKSRMILIAVNPSDPELKDVQNLNGLKLVYDWDYTKAFLENMDGKNIAGVDAVPAYRVVGEVASDEAIKFAMTRGHLFSYKEIMSMRNSCLRLYDYIWNSVEKIKESFKEKIKREKKRTSIVKKNHDVFSGNVIDFDKISDEEVSALGDNVTDFPKFFYDFRKKYGNHFKTCINYVKSSDLSAGIERHWFMQYLMSYTHLESLGYVYRCNRRGWIQNLENEEGKKEFDPFVEGASCSAELLDDAFPGSLVLLMNLYRSHKPSYRFIEYDSGIGGSKQRLYSWVFDNGKKTGCEKKEAEFSIFPIDVRWKRFSDLDELTRKGYIR